MKVQTMPISCLVKYVSCAALLIHCAAAVCDASPRAMRAPHAGPSSGTQAESLETSPVKPVLLGAIRFFQKYISPLDGPRCVLYPTCSQYGYLAIKKYGVFKGIVMTGDRLIRCNPSRTADHDYQPLPNGRLYDPPAMNAFVDE